VVRRRLQAAALEVFAERGFDRATLDEVASAASLTKGAIYSNFASKDELFYAMLSEQVLAKIEAVRAALTANTNGAPQGQTFAKIGRVLTEAFIEHRDWQLVSLDFWQRAVRHDDVRAQFVAHRQSLRTVMAAHLEEILDGARPPAGLSVDDVVTVVLALSNGLAIEQYVDPSAVSDDLFGRVLAGLSRNP
jgi:AcrR family transcriptional regulator